MLGSGIDFRSYFTGNKIANNIVAAPTGQSAITCEFTSIAGATEFRLNDVYSPGGVAPYGTCTNLTGTNRNLAVDPLFSDPASGDYHLRAGSPLIDAGYRIATSLPAADFDGDSRTLDGNGDGNAVVDIGVDDIQSSQQKSDHAMAGKNRQRVDFGNTKPNHPPLAVADAYSTAQDAPLIIATGGVLANDTDLDAGDTTTVVAINGQAANVGMPITLPRAHFSSRRRMAAVNMTQWPV